jgi:poly-gamma-glutamate capsule biosynthesis protein CapA/YwtB (metallophosphatase superfamily)
VTDAAPTPAQSRAVTLDLGNLADQNRVVINPAHITHVRLTGATSASNRKLEVRLVNGDTVAMNFDDPDRADRIFQGFVQAIDRAIGA